MQKVRNSFCCKKLIQLSVSAFCFFTLLSFNANAQVKYSEALAKTVMHIWKDSFALEGKPAKWTYDMGVILKGMEGLWYNTGNPIYFNYIQKQMDYFVTNEGKIKTYKPDEFNIDHINNGKLLMFLYKVTEKDKYWKAAQLLRQQLRQHPRTNEGGFWHKKIYPYQMWLDGLYMAQPFYAEYAAFEEKGTTDTSFNDIANQFIWMEAHARDKVTGLLYHAWDESKQQQWANKETGTSPLFWARAMGWYATALVDALDWFPKNHPKQKALVGILNRLVTAIEKQQDATTGLWYDILYYDGEGKEKNYFEASASSQFVYAVAKGVRKGYLPKAKFAIAEKGYQGIVSTFIKEEAGLTNLHGTVSVSGLGGKPYRDGSFNYYMSEKVIVNDPKGMGAFLLAANEMEMTDWIQQPAKNVLLDGWFNSERKKDITGQEVQWHYQWHEKSHPGFYFMQHLFNQQNATTSTLYTAPTKKALKRAQVFIIVDADNEKDKPSPNLMTLQNATAIANWVKKGGVLLLLHNDKGNAEFTQFNQLAKIFGIEFLETNKNLVEGKNFETGAVQTGNSNQVFTPNLKLFLKEISTLQLSGSAQPLITKEGDVVMATAKYGKGMVLAVGDPWLYNEYVDGRKLTPDFQNYLAAKDLVKWLLNNSK